MPRVLKRLERVLTKALELFVVLAMAVLVLDVVWGVFTRYALGEQAKWTEELARFLLIWVSLLGGALAFGRKAHLGIDIFVRALHRDARRSMQVLSQLVVFGFALAVFVVGGSSLAFAALSAGQETPALGWQMGYVYLAVPISGLFIVLYSVESLVESVWRRPAASGTRGNRSVPG
jgi:TRAP-type C4-dicarboxylate transport system permease small subunit